MTEHALDRDDAAMFSTEAQGGARDAGDVDPRPVDDVGIAVITRNRGRVLVENLQRLRAEIPPRRIVVVDNASTDGSRELVRASHPEVRVIALEENVGTAARNVAAEALETPLIAFSDDDSWWAPGALACAAALFQEQPSLGLVGARVIIEPAGRVDPVSREMAASPIGVEPGMPGPSVLGFVACGVVLRRAALLEVGGFHRNYGIGGEERLLAIDLAAHGWARVYVDSIVAHHAPGHSGPRPGRRRVVTRNDLWTAWLRYPVRTAAALTAALAAQALRDHDVRSGFGDAVAGLPWVVRERRVMPAQLQQHMGAL